MAGEEDNIQSEGAGEWMKGGKGKELKFSQVVFVPPATRRHSYNVSWEKNVYQRGWGLGWMNEMHNLNHCIGMQ